MKQRLFDPSTFSPGIVELDWLVLDSDRPLSEQLKDLTEDMLLVRYPHGLHLAVGWLPESDVTGRFVIEMSLNPDWWEPMYHAECSSLPELRATLQEAASRASKM